MDNNPLCEDFIYRAEETYKNKIVTPARTGGELIELCTKQYPFRPIEWDNVEFLGKRFLVHLNLKSTEVKTFLLKRNERTEMFYRYFRIENGIPAEWTYPLIYCYYNEKTDTLYSNDSLWSFQMNILRGIDTSDINDCTERYKNYLNDLYMFYEGREHLKSFQDISV